jgi:hypothetical protein
MTTPLSCAVRAALPMIFSLLCVTLASCGSLGSGATSPVGATEAQESPDDPRVRIQLYNAKLKQDPGLFAVHAALGAAYLDLARETYDLESLAMARQVLERSIAIQPGVDALASLAELCNFRHRYACALENAERAMRVDPKDGRTRALRVEAYLGLGETRRAEQLLDQPYVEDGAGYVLPAARAAGSRRSSASTTRETPSWPRRSRHGGRARASSRFGPR